MQTHKTVTPSGQRPIYRLPTTDADGARSQQWACRSHCWKRVGCWGCDGGAEMAQGQNQSRLRLPPDKCEGGESEGGCEKRLMIHEWVSVEAAR
jgi:hypothetical protein